jgi:hypothetical protein
MRPISELEMKAVSGGNDVIVVTGVAYWPSWAIDQFIDDLIAQSGGGSSGGGGGGGGEGPYYVEPAPPAEPPGPPPLDHYSPGFINSENIAAETDPDVLAKMSEQAYETADWFVGWADWYSELGNAYDFASALNDLTSLWPLGMALDAATNTMDELIAEMIGYANYWYGLGSEADQRYYDVTTT